MATFKNYLMNGNSFNNRGPKGSKLATFFSEVQDCHRGGTSEIHSFTDSELTVEVTKFWNTTEVKTYRKGKLVCVEEIANMELMMPSGENITYLKSYITKGKAAKSVFAEIGKSHKGTVRTFNVDNEDRLGFEIVVDKYYFWPFKRTEMMKVFNRKGEHCGYERRDGRKKITFLFTPNKKKAY